MCFVNVFSFIDQLWDRNLVKNMWMLLPFRRDNFSLCNMEGNLSSLFSGVKTIPRSSFQVTSLIQSTVDVNYFPHI